jgi:hypothetical protein
MEAQMKGLLRSIIVVFCLIAVSGYMANAQEMEKESKATKHIIRIYHIAPGKHAEFLKAMAEQQAIADEAGANPAQWYVHLDGDSWDYITVNEVDENEEVGKKIEELSKKKGAPTGMAAALQFRQFVASHTDTYTMGPYTAQELAKMAEAK